MFLWDECLEGHMLLGMMFNVASVVLLLLVAFSTPYNTSVYFLRTGSGTKYGAFGYCEGDVCTPKNVGYDHGPEIVGWLTRTQVLFPLAALFKFLSLLALILSLLKTGKFLRNSIYFRITALLGAALAVMAEIFALVLWVTARHRYNASDQPGRVTYGVALWLGLVGATIALLSACLGGPPYAGKGGMYRANRNIPYHL